MGATEIQLEGVQQYYLRPVRVHPVRLLLHLLPLLLVEWRQVSGNQRNGYFLILLEILGIYEDLQF